MDVSIFLAKVAGLYMVIVSLILLVNPDDYKTRAKKFLQDEMLTLLAGPFTLIIGLLIVVAHNVWVMGWPVIITIFGWLGTIKGVIFLLFPHATVAKFRTLIDKVNMRVVGIIYLLIGLFLCYKGFF